jgi:YVTN family beta-propeller protein
MAAFADFARLWGGIALLVAAVLSELRRRHQSDVVAGDWTPAYAAGTLVIGLALYYAKPWRDPVHNGPLLAVSQADGNAVTLLRLDVEEREVRTIPLECKGPFGLAFVRRDSIYSACWNGSKISVIDLGRGSESRQIPSARLPAWIAYRDGSDEIWISNEDRGTVSIYSASNAKLLAEVPTGKGASDIVFPQGDARAWISNEGEGTVSVLDGKSRRKIKDIPVGKVPQGMALAGHGNLVLVTNFGSNTLSLLDTSSLREIAQIPVCRGPVDVATAADRGSELGFVSCYGSGSVGVIDLDKKRTIQELSVGGKPFGITAHSNSGRVYVCVGTSNRIIVLDVNRPSRIVRRIPIPGTPLQLALAPGTD